MIAILFILAPFGFFLSRGMIHGGHHLFFCIVPLFLLAESLYKKPNDIQIKRLSLSLFFGYIGILTVYYFVASFVSGVDQKAAMFAFKESIFYVSAILIFISVTKSNFSDKFFYNVICGSVLFQVGLALLQSIGVDLPVLVVSQFMEAIRLLDERAMTGTLGNTNYLSAFIATPLPLFFRRYWCLTIPLIVYCILLSHTSTAALTAVVVTCMFFNDKRLWAALCIVAIQYVILGGFESLNVRFNIWGQAWEKIIQSWTAFLFGNGFGQTWGGKFPLHNEYVQGLYKFGAVGMGLIVSYLVTLRGNKYLFPCFIGICVNAIANHPFHMAPTAFLCILIIGLIERGRYDIQGNNRSC